MGIEDRRYLFNKLLDEGGIDTGKFIGYDDDELQIDCWLSLAELKIVVAAFEKVTNDS